MNSTDEVVRGKWGVAMQRRILKRCSDSRHKTPRAELRAHNSLSCERTWPHAGLPSVHRLIARRGSAHLLQSRAVERDGF